MFEDFYHLSGSPFQLNPDPSFYFASRGHSRALAYLEFGLYQREGFILITGEVGAGKTTLLRTLINEVDSREIVAAHLYSTRLDAPDMLRAVATAFGLSVGNEGKAQLLARIEVFLLTLAKENRRALLVVDEAQNLTVEAMEELRMLSNFQPLNRTLLQSFLVGQPELRGMLMSPSLTQLRQRISASYHLGPMDAKETRAYVLHRLAHVGWKDDPQLDEAIFPRLYEASGGIPRAINAIANRLLLVAYLAEKHEIGLAEFDQTVGELRNEVGVDSVSTTAQFAPYQPANGGTDLVPAQQSSSLLARLDRIEKNLTKLMEMMNKADEPQGKAPHGGAASAGAPPRWGPRVVRR